MMAVNNCFKLSCIPFTRPAQNLSVGYFWDIVRKQTRSFYFPVYPSRYLFIIICFLTTPLVVFGCFCQFFVFSVPLRLGSDRQKWCALQVSRVVFPAPMSSKPDTAQKPESWSSMEVTWRPGYLVKLLAGDALSSWRTYEVRFAMLSRLVIFSLKNRRHFFFLLTHAVGKRKRLALLRVLCSSCRLWLVLRTRLALASAHLKNAKNNANLAGDKRASKL